MRIFQFFLFLALTITMSSQLKSQGTFGATLFGGINAAQIDGDDAAGFNKIGLNLGIRGDFYVSEKIQAGMELTWSQTGSRTELVSSIPQLKLDINYIQVPVIFKFNDWYQEEEDYYRVNVLAGFSYGRLISSKAFNSVFEGRTELWNKNDVSLHLGASYMFNEKWALTIRWNRGLTKVFDSANNPGLSRSYISRYLTFRIEYSL